MSALPFYVVTLPPLAPEPLRAALRALPPEAIPELRLDLFPEEDPGALVEAFGRRCVVSCRRRTDSGTWDGDEAGRLDRLHRALGARPAWLDLEWELELPAWAKEARAHAQLLRSVHTSAGPEDLAARCAALPEGDAYKWVGRAARLADNARLKGPLSWARAHGVRLSAFLGGPKGVASRCLQGAWGGGFTYAAPDAHPPVAAGQLPLSRLISWRVHRLRPGCGLCGVLGHPVLHSEGPAFHNARFQRAFKDLLYLPLDAGDAEEGLEALEALDLLGASLTMPLKRTLPARLGLGGPLNTLWRRTPCDAWQAANTDALALAGALGALPKGPVLVLGDGGVAETSRGVLAAAGRPHAQASRRHPLLPEVIRALGPVGLVQATALGMEEGDGLPFPELLEAARPTLRWAVEWVYARETALVAWARAEGLALVEGDELFRAQAEAQSRCFIAGCGGA